MAAKKLVFADISKDVSKYPQFTLQTLKSINNYETVGGPYHWGPPSRDAAATPSLRHWLTRVDAVKNG